jgi:hypothetical protein
MLKSDVLIDLDDWADHQRGCGSVPETGKGSTSDVLPPGVVA